MGLFDVGKQSLNEMYIGMKEASERRAEEQEKAYLEQLEADRKEKEKELQKKQSIYNAVVARVEANLQKEAEEQNRKAAEIEKAREKEERLRADMRTGYRETLHSFKAKQEG